MSTGRIQIKFLGGKLKNVSLKTFSTSIVLKRKQKKSNINTSNYVTPASSNMFYEMVYVPRQIHILDTD